MSARTTVTMFEDKPDSVSFVRANIQGSNVRPDGATCCVTLEVGSSELCVHFDGEASFRAFCEKHNIEIKDCRDA